MKVSADQQGGDRELCVIRGEGERNRKYSRWAGERRAVGLAHTAAIGEYSSCCDNEGKTDDHGGRISGGGGLVQQRWQEDFLGFGEVEPRGWALCDGSGRPLFEGGGRGELFFFGSATQ